jgi:hypothetical protein
MIYLFRFAIIESSEVAVFKDKEREVGPDSAIHNRVVKAFLLLLVDRRGDPQEHAWKREWDGRGRDYRIGHGAVWCLKVAENNMLV